MATTHSSIKINGSRHHEAPLCEVFSAGFYPVEIAGTPPFLSPLSV
jgi:hypothetical protein